MDILRLRLGFTKRFPSAREPHILLLKMGSKDAFEEGPKRVHNIFYPKYLLPLMMSISRLQYKYNQMSARILYAAKLLVSTVQELS